MTRIRDYDTLVFLHITSRGIGGEILDFSLNVVDTKPFLEYKSGQLDESEADLPISLYKETFDLEHGNHLPDIKDIVPDINSYCIITYNGFEYDIPKILDEEINMFDKAVKVFDLTKVFAEWYPVEAKDLINSVDPELTTTKGLRAAFKKHFPQSNLIFWNGWRRCPVAFIEAMMLMCLRKQNEFGDLEDYKIIGDLIKKKNPPYLIYNYDNLKEYHLSSIQ